MSYFDWSQDKNEILKEQRGVSFEDVIIAIEQGDLITVLAQKSKKYEHQRIYIVVIKNYVYLVPFVEDNEKIFLKTIYPSRKYTKKYLREL